MLMVAVVEPEVTVVVRGLCVSQTNACTQVPTLQNSTVIASGAHVLDANGFRFVAGKPITCSQESLQQIFVN